MFTQYYEPSQYRIERRKVCFTSGQLRQKKKIQQKQLKNEKNNKKNFHI